MLDLQQDIDADHEIQLTDVRYTPQSLVKDNSWSIASTIWSERSYCWSVAFSIVMDYDKADEVVQDALVNAYCAACTEAIKLDLLLRSRLRAWLRTIVVHAAIDYIRREKRLWVVDDRDNWLYGSKDGDYDNPETVWLHTEESREFERLLNRLHYSYREVIEWVVLRGKTYETIAKIENSDIRTVRTRYHRAVKSLTKIVKEEQIKEIDFRRWLEVYVK